VVDFAEVAGPQLAAKPNVGKVPFRHADFEIIMQPGPGGMGGGEPSMRGVSGGSAPGS